VCGARWSSDAGRICMNEDVTSVPAFFFSSYGDEWHWKNGSDLNDLAEVTLIRLEDQICIKLMKDTGFGDEALVETRR